MKTRKRSIICCLLILMSITGLYAQESYSVQVKALKESYEKKNGDAIRSHLSAQLGFDLIPQDRLTPDLIDRLFAEIFDMPLVSLEVKETKVKEVVIVADFGEFQELGKIEASLLFDDEGKITKIGLIDKMLKISAERRREEANNAKPMPDEELTKKYSSKKVQIKTKRGYQVVGDLYEVSKDKPVILLCHQAGYNKFEYIGIALKLNDMGFNALAVDLTGGGDVNETKNETMINRGEIESEDIDVRLSYTEDELAVTVDYLYERYNQPITIWGSSFSATMVIYEAQKNDKINASLSFSAFNHFREARPKLEEVLPKINKPMFMTSSRGEASIIEGILKEAPLKNGQYHFKPEGSGQHGAKALWNGQRNADEYWVAVTAFLNEVYEK